MDTDNEKEQQASVSKARELHDRGIRRAKDGDHEGAIADFTAVIDMSEATDADRAIALCNRGTSKGRLGDRAGEIADYTMVIEMPGAPIDDRATALINRGFRKGQRFDRKGEIEDYTTVIDMTDVSDRKRAIALHHRGFRKSKLDDWEDAINDYHDALNLIDAESELGAEILANMSGAYFRTNRLPEALEAAVDAILSYKLSDGGHRFTEWFARRISQLREVVAASGQSPKRRGGALAFINASTGPGSKEFIEQWMNDKDFSEAGNVFKDVLKVWKQNL
jgi:tetratricopeptide (TPR) repeat protein